MGECTDEIGQGVKLLDSEDLIPWERVSEQISSRYAVPNDEHLQFLMEQLDGIRMRDVEFAPCLDTPEERRRAVAASARQIKDQAEQVAKSISKLREAVQSFHEAIGPNKWSAVMLAEVFDIEFISPTDIEPPEIFDSIRGIFHTHSECWLLIQAEIDALLKLPVRDRLRKNRVRNHSLYQALIACRSYWEAQERPWGRSNLEISEFRKTGTAESLKGSCERFVADMLLSARIPFDMVSLNSTWSNLEPAKTVRGRPAGS